MSVYKVEKIVVHCSDSDFGTAIMIDQWHRAKGWSMIGYQAVIENGFPTADHHAKGERWKLLNGMISSGRPVDADEMISDAEAGAHAYGWNKNTIAPCLIGRAEFTRQQVISLIKWVRLMAVNFKLDLREETIKQCVVGHCELPGVAKTCPNMDMDIIRRLVLNKTDAFSLMRALPNVKEVY